MNGSDPVCARSATPVLWLACAIGALALVELVVPTVTAWVGIGTSTGVQPWRALTYPFTSYGVLSAAITIVICVAVASGVGRGLRPWCLVGCFAVSGLGAAAAASWLVSYSSGGAAAALLGTIAATTAVKRHRRGDIRGEIVLLVVLVSLALFAGSPDWVCDVGAIAAGASVGQLLATRRPGDERVRGPLLVVGVICLVLLVLAWVR